MAVEREFSPTRLEAISDGVIAVVITIMVLELRPPENASLGALLALWPKALAYALSFAFVATYWVNHRYLFRHVKAVDDVILWANLALLFLISLIPFSTAWMGETALAPLPTAVNAGVLLACGLGYGVLSAAIARHINDRTERARLAGGMARTLNIVGLVAYAVAVGAAFIAPWISVVLIFAVVAVYMTPLARPE